VDASTSGVENVENLQDEQLTENAKATTDTQMSHSLVMHHVGVNV
jgi:hypothetical protein